MDSTDWLHVTLSIKIGFIDLLKTKLHICYESMGARLMVQTLGAPKGACWSYCGISMPFKPLSPSPNSFTRFPELWVSASVTLRCCVEPLRGQLC